MTIDDALFNYLSTAEALNGTLVYPIRFPQKVVLPAIAYRRSDGGYEQSLDGGLPYAHPSFEVVIASVSYSAGQTIAQNLWNVLQAFSGTWGDVTVFNVLVDSRSDEQEIFTSDASDNVVYLTTFDITILYEETIPEN